MSAFSGSKRKAREVRKFTRNFRRIASMAQQLDSTYELDAALARADLAPAMRESIRKLATRLMRPDAKVRI